MNTGRTVLSVAGANAIAQGGTEVAKPAIPFLDAPLWFWNISGVETVMTPQAIIVVVTGILSVIVLSLTIVKKVTS